jgi:hypothetical protein
VVVVSRRLRNCVENWPGAETGAYDPRCCRFPKSCSADVYDQDAVTEADLEPKPEAAPLTERWASFDLPGGESTSAALRRVEQERDEARAEVRALENSDCVHLAKLELDLAGARTELDAVRTARDNLDRELGEARTTIRAMAGHPNPAGLNVTQSGPSTQGAPPE